MKSASEHPCESLRIVVLGYLVRGPIGGMAWHHLQYVMGLRDLGHDVWFLEDSGDSEYCCYDPSRDVTDRNPGYGLDFAADCFRRIGLEDRWAYHDAHGGRWHGSAADAVPRILGDTDLLINLSCSNPIRPWFAEIELRALVDTDPLFTQLRILTDPDRRALAEAHNRFFTFAENIDSCSCGIPDAGFRWHPTRQPIVLDAWPVTEVPAEAGFTTVMQWNSYPALEYRGRRYGMKAESFAPFIDLPASCPGRFELAMGGASAPRDLLRAKGWAVCNPNRVAGDPWSYQKYIQRSRGEFSVAKHGYVSSRSGWFSERSAAYLASGRPVVTQDTGFPDRLPTGAGLLAFRTAEEARTACAEVVGDPEPHQRAARELAREYFDAHMVLSGLIDKCMERGVTRSVSKTRNNARTHSIS